MNDPQVLVTNKANPTGVWIDLTECRDEEAFYDLVIEGIGTYPDYIVSESDDVPKCYIQDGKLHPYAFEFAQRDEEQRTIVFAYSTISTDIANWLIPNALKAWENTVNSRAELAKTYVEQVTSLEPRILDCIDYDKLASKLEEFYDFVDIASKTYVFNK